MERLSEELPDDGEGRVGSLAPIVRSERDALVVEAHPGARDQVRVHQEEPAVGAVLRRPRFSGDVRVDTVGKPDALARPLVDHPAHHVDHVVGDVLGDDVLRLGFVRLEQHVAESILDPKNRHRLVIDPAAGQRAVSGHHFLQRDGAGAERDRGHGVQLASDPCSPRQVGDTFRPDPLDELRGDRIHGLREPRAQSHGLIGVLTGVLRPPDAAARPDRHRLIDEPVVRVESVLEGGGI